MDALAAAYSTIVFYKSVIKVKRRKMSGVDMVNVLSRPISIKGGRLQGVDSTLLIFTPTSRVLIRMVT